MLNILPSSVSIPAYYTSRRPADRHAPAWGATTSCRIHRTALRRFNPRPRMGGDMLPPILLVTLLTVSIHAPAWGATLFIVRKTYGYQVSIHAPAWGATTMESIIIKPKTVSIHAPAWGATRVSVTYDPKKIVSIHAPAWGATASKIKSSA